MIILITGVPGSGKTCFLVSELSKVKDRPIFVDGIPELKVDHQPCPPLDDWTIEKEDASSQDGKKLSFSFPPTSIVVVDECQRIYRPRSASSKVPPYVAAFETHRHEGIDFYLICQHPNLLDSNVRRLVGKHIHFRATWAGRYKYEWNECGDVDSQSARNLSANSKYTLDKKAFELYKSSEEHTKIKRTIPKSVYIVFLCLLVMLPLAYRVFNRMNGAFNGESYTTANNIEIPTQTNGINVSPAPSGARNPQQQYVTIAEYIKMRQPRIKGLMHTAPIYDELTKAKTVPIIQGCMKTPKGCNCFTQQGSRYDTDLPTCLAFLENGQPFYEWKEEKRQAQGQGVGSETAQLAAQAQTTPTAAPFSFVLPEREPLTLSANKSAESSTN